MPIQTGLYRRNATWTFRIRVPARLTGVIRRQYLKRSLRTKDQNLARIRGARLLRLARELFQRVESRLPMLKRDEVEKMIRAFHAVKFEDWRLERFSKWDRHGEDLIDDWNGAGPLDDLKSATMEFQVGSTALAERELPRFRQIFGLELEPGSRDEALVKEYLMRSLRQLAADKHAFLHQNLYDGNTIDPLFQRPLPDPAIVRLKAAARASFEKQENRTDLVPQPGLDTTALGAPAIANVLERLLEEEDRDIFGEAIKAALEAGCVDLLDPGPTRRRVLYPGVKFPSVKALWSIPEVMQEFIDAKKKAERSTKTLGDYMRKFFAELDEDNPAKKLAHFYRSDDRGLFFGADISSASTSIPDYEIIHPVTGKPVKKPSRGWGATEPVMLERINNNEVLFGPDETTIPLKKSYLTDVDSIVKTPVLYKDGRAASGVLKSLFGEVEVDERYDIDIFTANQTGQDFSRATAKLKNHIYDYAITDSDIERDFVTELDTSSEVVVYAKLPRGFLIPTPVGGLQPRLGDIVQGGQRTTHLLRGRNQRHDVVAEAARSRKNENRMRQKNL